MCMQGLGVISESLTFAGKGQEKDSWNGHMSHLNLGGFDVMHNESLVRNVAPKMMEEYGRRTNLRMVFQW